MFAWLRDVLRPAPADPPAKIVCGLGNPGHSYMNTRHNAGYRVVARLAAQAGGKWVQHRRLANLCRVEIDGVRVLLVQPLTFMNLSGRAVKPLLRRWHLSPEALLVIHDDLDLPPGSIRLRPGGSSGGHKGVQSIIDHLNSTAFCRLRIGIGRPQDGSVVDYVLMPFTRKERQDMEAVWDYACDAARCWIAEGIEAAMNRFNRRAP